MHALYNSIANWPAFYAEAYCHLKPGGWLKQLKYSVDWQTDDDSIPPGYIYHEASHNYMEAGKCSGHTFRMLDLRRDFIEQAGFKQMVKTRYKMPPGPWVVGLKLKEVGC